MAVGYTKILSAFPSQCIQTGLGLCISHLQHLIRQCRGLVPEHHHHHRYCHYQLALGHDKLHSHSIAALIGQRSYSPCTKHPLNPFHFDPEDGGRMFHKDVSIQPEDNMEQPSRPHSKRQHIFSHFSNAFNNVMEWTSEGSAQDGFLLHTNINYYHRLQLTIL
jgi:hypothetical protein